MSTAQHLILFRYCITEIFYSQSKGW